MYSPTVAFGNELQGVQFTAEQMQTQRLRFKNQQINERRNREMESSHNGGLGQTQYQNSTHHGIQAIQYGNFQSSNQSQNIINYSQQSQESNFPHLSQQPQQLAHDNFPHLVQASQQMQTSHNNFPQVMQASQQMQNNFSPRYPQQQSCQQMQAIFPQQPSQGFNCMNSGVEPNGTYQDFDGWTEPKIKQEWPLSMMHPVYNQNYGSFEDV